MTTSVRTKSALPTALERFLSQSPVIDASSISAIQPGLTDVIVAVDKPKGWSSSGVGRKLKYLLRGPRVGYAGTLDPMATGLLLCMVGKATKTSRYLTELDKSYEATMRLGETTPSYDAETPVEHSTDARHISIEDVRRTFEMFVGTIQQITPAYSAVRVGGEPLYRAARAGRSVVRPPRIVDVYSIDVVRMVDQDVTFCVRCSSGTYIRALAHDAGVKLGVGAHLIALRRTHVGPFGVDTAIPLQRIMEALQDGS